MSFHYSSPTLMMTDDSNKSKLLECTSTKNDVETVTIKEEVNEEIIVMKTEVKEEMYDCEGVRNVEFLDGKSVDVSERFLKSQGLPLGNRAEMFKKSFYCNYCEMTYEDYCPGCLPTNIEIVKGCKIEDYRVFAAKNIPQGVLYGPYEAPFANHSSWMRFVNVAAMKSQPNLLVFESFGSIYFKTLRDIKIGEELLVYLNNNDTKYPGIDLAKREKIGRRCSQCCLEFSDWNSLINHARECLLMKKEKSSKAKTNFFDCKICKLRILDEQYYRRHITICQRKKRLCFAKLEINACGSKFKCIQCNYMTNKESNLKRHVFTHKDDKTFKCPTCEKSFKQKDGLQKHIKIHNEGEPTGREKQYKCEHCEFSTHHKSDFSKHIRVHTKIKLFKCTYKNCGYQSIRAYHIKSHIKNRHMSKN